MSMFPTSAYQDMWAGGDKKWPGRLVVFCGFDGSGKSTQLERLADALTAKGRRVSRTRQPTDWYRTNPDVRRYLDHGGGTDMNALAEFAARDRSKHIEEVIKPQLQRGIDVLCDRYVFSSLAYFEARGVGMDTVARLNRGVMRPDLSVFLDMPAPMLLARILKRDGKSSKYEERSLDTIGAVVTAFQRIADNDAEFWRIDAAQDQETIGQSILAKLEQLRSPVEEARQ